MIELRGNLSIANVEEHLRLISKGGGQPVRVRTSGEGGALGGQAAFTQALLTWARRTRDRNLGTWLGADADVQDFAESVQGLTALLVSQKVLKKDEFPVPASLVAEAYGMQLRKMNSTRVQRIGKGVSTTLLCVDHLGVQYANPRCFYNTRGTISEDDKFLDLFEQIAELMSIRTIPRYDMAELGGLIFELVQNTDRHALLDVDDNVIIPSVRGMYVRRWDIDESLEKTVSLSAPGLRDFIEVTKPLNTGREKLPIIEISVFDAGPGMAATLLGRRLAKEDEIDFEASTVMRCFNKYESRTLDPSSGLGLHRAINVIRENNGLLRVRTGRVSLYSRPLSSPKGQPIFRDWVTGSEQYTPMIPVAGTLITILLPAVQRR